MGAQQSGEEASGKVAAADGSSTSTDERTVAIEAASAVEARTDDNAAPANDARAGGARAGNMEPESGQNSGGGDGPDAKVGSNEGQEDDDDEEEGCAFCKFMKGGGCKNEFVAWEKCVADSRETGDFVGQCADITEALQACMNHADNKDYYQLFLDDQEEYVREQKEIDQKATDTEAAAGAGTDTDHAPTEESKKSKK
eukprot:jgi/Ulvmu1/12553/UM090_0040.1